MRRIVHILAAAALVGVAAGTVVRAADSAAKSVPVIKAKTTQVTAIAGGTVTLDVYITNVTNLAAYQLELSAKDSNGLAATTQSVDVDTNRKTFVFAGRDFIDPIKVMQKGIGVVMWEGVVDVPANAEAYLATFTINVPAEAKGTLHVTVKPDRKPSVLSDRTAQVIPFTTGAGVDIQIVEPTRGRVITRVKKRS